MKGVPTSRDRRRRLWASLAVLIILAGARPARAQQGSYIVPIPGAPATKIPIAIAGFSPFSTDGGGDLAKTAGEILTADLKFSQIFDVIDPALLPFEPTSVRIDQERLALPALAAIKVPYLVVAALTSRGKELLLEGRLMAVNQGVMVVGKRYVGEATALRTMVHRLADQIVLSLTGEKGVASTRIAYVSAVGNAKEIFVMDYDGFNPVMITGNRTLNLSPRWSPDGHSIAYTSYRSQNPDLYVLDMRSGRREVVSSAPGLNITPAWSPDGQWLVLAMSKAAGTNLFLIPRTGGAPRQLTFGSSINVSPSFSPNGQQIVFNADRGGTPQIYVMDVQGANLRRLTFQGEYNASPRWSPRGDKVAFVSRVNGRNQIALMDPDGSGVQYLTLAGNNEDPAWSPDGRHLVFTSTRDGRRNLYVMHADGSEQRRLTNQQESYLADWSP